VIGSESVLAAPLYERKKECHVSSPSGWKGRTGHRRLAGHRRGHGPASRRRWSGRRDHIRVLGRAGKECGVEDRAARCPGRAFASDQADPEQAANLVDEVVAAFGRLDILVNNAGIFVTGPIDAEETDQAAMGRQYAVNVSGVVAVTRAAAKVMGEGGRIVSAGSVSADRTPFPGLGDYSATKAAITAYTRAWARNLGPRGITVNAVQTSSIATDMNPDVGPFADVQRSMNALGRYGRPEEMAAAIAFLAGPDATFVTGATLNVDGGFNA
jgi:NAD(P)-dependent dehydrogenase (short-subunit alcohol dehydrogenase family)